MMHFLSVVCGCLMLVSAAPAAHFPNFGYYKFINQSRDAARMNSLPPAQKQERAHANRNAAPHPSPHAAVKRPTVATPERASAKAETASVRR